MTYEQKSYKFTMNKKVFLPNRKCSIWILMEKIFSKDFIDTHSTSCINCEKNKNKIIYETTSWFPIITEVHDDISLSI